MARHLVINWYSPEECSQIMQENKIVCEIDMEVKASVFYQYKVVLWKRNVHAIWGIVICNFV